MKITIDLSDPETRAVWEAILRAKEEVAGWPAWKRGEEAKEKAETPVKESRPEAPRSNEGFNDPPFPSPYR